MRDAASIARRVSAAVSAAGYAGAERAVKEAIRAELVDLSDVARGHMLVFVMRGDHWRVLPPFSLEHSPGLISGGTP